MNKKGKGIAAKINDMCKDVPINGQDIVILKNTLRNELKKVSAKK